MHRKLKFGRDIQLPPHRRFVWVCLLEYVIKKEIHIEIQMKPAIIGGRLSAIAMIRVIYYRTESVDAGGGSHGAIIQVLPLRQGLL